MKKLGTKAFDEIRIWIYRNARPLDLSIWKFHFEDGSREEILDRLAFYQNEDGGFGNGLEPDSWNPESSPYATLIAINILREIGFEDRLHPIFKGIFQYLESGAHCTEDGWLFSIPSNDKYPRAPWWSYDETSNGIQGMGLTALLSAFIIRYGDMEPELYEKALNFADKVLEKFGQTEDFGEMGIGGLGALAQAIEDKGLSNRFNCSHIKAELKNLADKAIERDPEKWEGYTPRPSAFICFPASPFYPGNEEIVDKELDYLIDTRNPGGVWKINWTWFQLGEQYAKEFALSENWWMASKAIEKLGFIKSFNRL